MCQSFLAEYCNSDPRWKHICLTIITSGLLLLVGCTVHKASPAKVESTPAKQPLPAALPAQTPQSSAQSGQADEQGWQRLFDGKTLNGWAVTDFAGRGEVKVKNGSIVLGEGVMTGITWTNPLPAEMNYEIALDAMRVEGNDFFCGLTFPVRKDPCSLIVGGWGGGVVGLSSLDGEDAANNETTKVAEFEKERWYAIKLRVQPARIQAWIDGEKYVDVDTTDRKISIRIEVELSRPLGIASWNTKAALKNIRMRKL